jgi:transposase-like protein
MPLRAFKKALIERALGAEMSHHLGYAVRADKPQAATPTEWQERQDSSER